MKDACSEERVKIFEDRNTTIQRVRNDNYCFALLSTEFSSEEASYAEAKYQLSYNQYLIETIVVISYALYCGVPVFKYDKLFFELFIGNCCYFPIAGCFTSE